MQRKPTCGLLELSCLSYVEDVSDPFVDLRSCILTVSSAQLFSSSFASCSCDALSSYYVFYPFASFFCSLSPTLVHSIRISIRRNKSMSIASATILRWHTCQMYHYKKTRSMNQHSKAKVVYTALEEPLLIDLTFTATHCATSRCSSGVRRGAGFRSASCARVLDSFHRITFKLPLVDFQVLARPDTPRRLPNHNDIVLRHAGQVPRFSFPWCPAEVSRT